MSDRKPYVGGNWKMNLNRYEAIGLARAVAEGAAGYPGVDIAIFPPFTFLDPISDILSANQATAGNCVKLGAQDFYHKSNGAFTGEVSLAMLKELGVQVVLAGHSERRHVLGENDVLVNAKVRAALEAGLQVILCVGETLEQRELGQTDAINAAQISYGLAGVNKAQMAEIVIAYEPVWAIGTGKTATAADAQAAHAAIRNVLAQMFDDKTAQGVRIQYGGSLKPGNAGELCSQPDIDGGLIGGASLKPDDFLAIIAAAASTPALAN